MNKFVRYIIVAIIIIFLSLSAGQADEDYYVDIGFRQQVIYPGEPINLDISGNMKSKIKKDIRKIAILRIYKLAEEDLGKDYKQVISGKNPLQKVKKVLNFTYDGDEWFYINDKLQVKGLPSGHYLFALSSEARENFHPVNITRLGVITKTDNEKLLIFVQDHKTGEPVKGAELLIIDSERQKTYNALSGDDGLKVVYYSEMKDYVKGSNLQVMAKKGNDSATTFSRAYDIPARLKGYIYTDRPIYRPSQKVYVKGMLRTYTDGKFSLARDEKVAVKIVDPKGKQIKKVELKTDQYGNVSTDFLLTEKPALGVYQINLTMAKSDARGTFKVEEYRKPEFEIIVKPGKDFYVQSDKINAEVFAKYYFGSPVPDTKFSYQVMRSYYFPYQSAYEWWEEDYMSGRYSYGYGGVVASGNGITGKDGKAKISFDAQKWENDAVYTIVVRMVDKSRREVTGTSSLKVTRGEFYLSADADKYFYETGDKVNLKIKALNYRGKPVETPLTVKIVRTVYKKNKSETKDVLTKDLKTNDAGTTQFVFTPDSPGYYNVQLKAKDSKKNEISYTQYFYCSSEDAYYSWYNFSNIDVIQDKSYYEAGETATLFLTIPDKDAWALVAVEGDQIHKYQVLKFEGNSSVMKLNIPESYAPNVFLSITYLKNREYRHGSKRIAIPDKKNFMTVKIKHDREKYKPRETATFKIETLDYRNNPLTAQVTMGVADESIYAVNPETAPNIQQFFYGLKNNQVYTNVSFYNYSAPGGLIEYDSYDLDETISDKEMTKSESPGKSKPKSRIQATGKKDMVQPDFVREFFPDTCFFNPNIITDQNGTASVTVALPDSLTTWRATARGITTDTKVGEATDKITVRKELLVRLITPRFLTERDEPIITGIVHNYLKTEKEVVVQLKVTGVKLLDKEEVKVKIKPGDSAKIDWKVKADRIGEASFLLKALTDEESDAMKLKIPILAHGTEKYSAQSGATGKSESVILELPDQCNRNTANLLIRVSPSIASSMFGALKYLAGYPYGCVEQTMSRFLPTVIVSKAIGRFDIYDEKLNKELPKMVQKGFERLYDFHHSDGGWGWWKDDESHPYMTAYVVYGLTRASDAGYQTRKDKISQAISWLENNYEKQSDFSTKTYMLFAMSEAGKFNKQWALDLYSERNSLDNYSCALLALMFEKNNMKENALEMISILENSAEDAGTMCTWKGKSNHYGWTDNQVETTAYALMAFIKVKPDSPLVVKAVRYLSISRTGDRWFSTKDTAAAVMALTEYLQISKELHADYSGTVAVNGKIVKQFTFTDKDVGGKELEFRIPGKYLLMGKNNIIFEKNGDGKLYFSAFLVHYTKEENIKAESAGFKVKREYFLINPKVDEGDKKYLIPINGLQAKLISQDKVFVKLTVTGSANYEYAMVEDPKPAGFEIEDKPESIPESGGKMKSLRYMPYNYAQREIRDDRMVFFITHFNKGTNTFTYTMRAETPGEFHTMPAKATLMYIPEIGGISNEMIFNIEEKTDNASRSLGVPIAEESPRGFWDNLSALFQ